MSALYSTRDAHTLVVGYVRVESAHTTTPFDIAQLCSRFFGDFSHLIEESQCFSEICSERAMWYVEQAPRRSEFPAQFNARAVRMRMNEDRARLKRGSKCRVYSSSKKKWFLGEVAQIFTDEVGEWLEVRYDRAMSKQVQRDSTDIYPEIHHDVAMPHCGVVLRNIPLPMSFREPLMDVQEYRLIELKELKEEMSRIVAVLEIDDSLTMEVPVSGLWQTINKLRELSNSKEVVMVTVVSGPRWTKDSVEMVQCVVDARAVENLSVSPSALPCPDLTKSDGQQLSSDSDVKIRRSWGKGDQVQIYS